MKEILDLLRPYSDLITAAATAAIAVLTAVLAIVSNRQAKLTREALITTERAFVYLEDIDPRYVVQQWPELPAVPAKIMQLSVRPKWKNSGTTPTRNMRVNVNWSHWPGPMPQNFSYAYGVTATNMFLGPQATEWSEAIVIDPNVATEAMNDRARIFIWGQAEYDDIFRGTRHHFTRWCYRLHIHLASNGLETQLVAEGNYNCSDEDSNLT